MAFWDGWFSKDGKSSAQQLKAAQDDHETVKALVAMGANPNAVNTGGQTPLMAAVAVGNSAEVFRLLVGEPWKVDFNEVASKAQAGASAPAPADPVATDEDIKVGKPLSFKPKA